MLDLSKTGLINYPHSLTNLPYLEELLLSDNQLSSAPNGFRYDCLIWWSINIDVSPLSELTALKVLELGGNRFTELPPVILSLTKLHTLNLSNNDVCLFEARLRPLTRFSSLT